MTSKFIEKKFVCVVDNLQGFTKGKTYTFYVENYNEKGEISDIDDINFKFERYSIHTEICGNNDNNTWVFGIKLTEKIERKDYKFSVRRYGPAMMEINNFIPLEDYREQKINSILTISDE